MNLAQLVHKIAKNPDFADQVRLDPQAALGRAGISLDDGALQALLSVLETPGARQRWMSDTKPESGPSQWVFGLKPDMKTDAASG